MNLIYDKKTYGSKEYEPLAKYQWPKADIFLPKTIMNRFRQYNSLTLIYYS